MDWSNYSLIIIHRSGNNIAVYGNTNQVKDPNEAIQNFDKALQIDPNATGALNNKGDVLYELGRHDEAIQNYDKVLQIDPNNQGTLSMKNSALKELDR